MAIYYIDGKNYLSSLNKQFFTTADNTGPDLRKYKTMLYINGKFRAIKPYIGKTVQISASQDGFYVTSDGDVFQFITADNEVFVSNEEEMIMMAAATPGSEEEEVITKFSCIRVNPYIIHGMITSDGVPYGSLVDNYGKVLVDNYGKYLIP